MGSKTCTKQLKNVRNEQNLLTKKCVPAKIDVLTNKMYYPGAYYPGCTVLVSQTENYIGLLMDIPRLNEESEKYE